jgi:hypothetical protein
MAMEEVVHMTTVVAFDHHRFCRSEQQIGSPPSRGHPLLKPPFTSYEAPELANFPFTCAVAPDIPLFALLSFPHNVLMKRGLGTPPRSFTNFLFAICQHSSGHHHV